MCDRRRGIGADGLLVGESADGLRGADGAVQRRRQPGRDERQRHPLLRPGARQRVAATSSRSASSPTPASGCVTLSPTDDPDTIEASVDMGAVEPLDEPAGWDELGCHPDRPVAHLSVGNPHSVVGVDEVDAVDLRPSRIAGAAHQPRDRRARPRAERDHDARPRARRRHHRGLRHGRRAPRRSPPLQWGLRRRRACRKSWCTWTAGVPKWRLTARPVGRHTHRPGDLHRTNRDRDRDRHHVSTPYNEALGSTLIDRSVRERIVLVGVTLPGHDG